MIFKFHWLIIILMGVIAGWLTSLLPLEYSLGAVQWAVPALGLWLAYLLYLHMGWRWPLLVLTLGIWALVMELIGTSTWWPYGAFEYQYHLSYELWWLVPITLGLIRPVLVLSIAARVRDVFTINTTRIRVVVGTLALVGLDLLLDPVHVAQGIRSYADGGQWFGVPLSNYLWRLWTWGISMLIATLFLDNKKSLPDLLIASGWFLWGYFSIQFLLNLVI